MSTNIIPYAIQLPRRPYTVHGKTLPLLQQQRHLQLTQYTHVDARLRVDCPTETAIDHTYDRDEPRMSRPTRPDREIHYRVDAYS